MITLPRAAVQETSLHSFTAEIAELAHSGYLPRWGQLPNRIDIPGVGNGQPFFMAHSESREGDLLFVRYQQLMGCVNLTIFND